MKNTKPVTHTISIIRNRGQLTIPDSIRALRQWASPNSVITITSDQPDEIIIRPQQSQKIDWDNLWKQMKRVRAFKGKGGGNLSSFVIKDRETHF